MSLYSLNIKLSIELLKIAISCRVDKKGLLVLDRKPSGDLKVKVRSVISKKKTFDTKNKTLTFFCHKRERCY